MSSDELLKQIEAAEQALAGAPDRSKAVGSTTPSAAVAELRDAVSLASMKLIRLRGKWEREFGKWRDTSEH
jgi:hypothetical protein